MNVEAIMSTIDHRTIMADLDTLESLLHKTTKPTMKSLTKAINPLTVEALEINQVPTAKEVASFREQLKHIPQVKMTLAHYPTTDQLLLLVKWCRQHLHPEAIVDVTMNPNIIGGIQINWQGIFFDGSLVKQISNKQPTTNY